MFEPLGRKQEKEKEKKRGKSKQGYRDLHSVM
jgi:hypothetical protein